MSRRKGRNPIADLLAYLAVRLAAMFLHMFPIDANLRTARAIGDLWWMLGDPGDRRLGRPRAVGRGGRACPWRGQPFQIYERTWAQGLAVRAFSVLLPRGLGKRFAEHRRRIMGHLRDSLGDCYDEVELAYIGQRSCQHLVSLAMEFLFTARLIQPQTWRRYVRLRDLGGPLELLLSGSGAVMLTGHYGNWELLGYMLATLGFELDAVARPFDNPRLNALLMGEREKTGLRVLYKKGAAASMDDVLANKGVLCFIADQNAGRKGLFVPFFGRLASTYKSIALLARAHEVPVIIGFARRLSDRFEYEVAVPEVILPQDWEQAEDEVYYITARFNRAIEALVREQPEQYLWVHRRWKTRPPRQDGERDGAGQAKG